MLRSKIFSNLLVPVLILCIFIYPCLEISALPVYSSIIQLEVKESLPIYQTYDLASYNSILQLIEDVINGNIQDKSPDQIEQINRILALLAEQGSVIEDPVTLQEDISELLGLHATPCGYNYTRSGIVLCESWAKKQWKNTKKFVKKHKTAIIIGAAVVVAVVVVAGITYGATAAAVPGALGSSSSAQKEPSKTPNVRSSKRIARIQETIANISEEEILEPIDSDFSIQDNARILGELLVYQNLEAEEALNYEEIQKAFSGNYLAHASLDTTKSFEENFHQMRGEYALEREYYEQALYDFNKIIETNPSNSDAYLSRASVYERIGDYPEAITDYERYLVHAKHTWECTSDFTIGFTKGLANGIKDSGVEFGTFIADTVTHPIDTGTNIWKSCCLLKELSASAEWNAISELLSPDAYRLITSWDELSMEERGELAGHAFGKHGGDFFIPGATSKVVSTGLSEIKQLGKVCKAVKNAEKSLVLEGITTNQVLTRTKIKSYLSNVDTLNKQQIISDLESIGLILKGKALTVDF